MPVLVVDDNATNRRILEGTLFRWGMKPAVVGSGEAALAALHRARDSGHPFPLVLTDAHMPEMDGFALAQRIKGNPQLVGAIIMVLASGGQRGDAARCRELGVAAYLTKPIRQSELQEAILSVLGRRSRETVPSGLVTCHLLREGQRVLRVLLAEDNAVDQQLASPLLEKRGHKVVVAGNGREALAALEKQPFDLVLMDVQMPEMDGFEATAAIREKEKATADRLPIIAMTAHAMKGDPERCLAAGMDGYVSKPIQAKTLFEVMEGLTATYSKGDTAAPAAQAGEILDPDEALAQVDGDAQLLAEMALLFLRDCPKLLADMQDAMARRDAKALERCAHTLKGSVSNFAAKQATEATLKLEQLARQGELTQSEPAFAALQEAFERLRPRLETLGKQFTKSREVLTD